MIKLDEKKLAQLKTGSQHFDEKYGLAGSPSRVEFEAKAKAWYYAELLRDERKRQKLTQQQLGERIGKKREYISSLEQGQTDMQLSTFMLIANALGLRFSLVVGQKDLQISFEELVKLWNEFEDVPIDKDECIDEDFYIWEKGTNKYHIWHWFDDRLPNGLFSYSPKCRFCDYKLVLYDMD